MSKSSRPGLYGQRGGTVTVIEQPVLRSYMRKAKAVFWITWAAVGLLAAVVAASKWEPILALLAGALIGLIIAAIASSVVAAWPVLRVIWWWLPELSLSGGLVTGWTELASHTDLIARLTAVAVLVGVPAAVSPVRRRINALAWCQISRHRIRTCFNEFIITNRDGSLPLILGARPTPAGERLWVFLRPGLSLADIASPLKTVIGDHIPGRKPAPAPVPVDLDLTDVTAADVTTPPKNGTAASTGQPKRPQWPNLPARNDAVPAGKTADEDLSDWI